MPLPDAMRFLSLGWWVLHAIVIMLVYQFGFVRGRGEARREQRQREIEKGR